MAAAHLDVFGELASWGTAGTPVVDSVAAAVDRGDRDLWERRLCPLAEFELGEMLIAKKVVLQACPRLPQVCYRQWTPQCDQSIDSARMAAGKFGTEEPAEALADDPYRRAGVAVADRM